MSSNLQGLSSSPSKGGNFVIPYQLDKHLTKQDTDKLLKFIESDIESNLILTDIDSSFYPRAFTDKDLNDLDYLSGNETFEQAEVVTKPKIIRASDKKACETGFNRMDPVNTSFGTASFQPDVIMISSHQRPGPDGSPALVPSGSQGFLPSANVSETGELFAPVRQLTFSDIDQSSQIEENYAQRSVSTPTRHTVSVQRNEQNNGIDSLQGRIDTDSSAEDSSEEREFRQLDGEADSQTEMLSTGMFNPMAMGLNKEFLDNFTGRNSGGKMNLSSNVFSPLGSRDTAFRHENGVGQTNRTITPPLHSPGVNTCSSYHSSPSHNYSNSQFHSNSYSSRSAPQTVSDQPELQFSMSPTRNQPDFMPYQYSQPDLDILNNQHQTDMYNQYDFHRHQDNSNNMAVPLHIRQSVSVGEERKTESEVVTSSQRQAHVNANYSSQGNINSNSVTAEAKEMDRNRDGDFDNQAEGEENDPQYSNVPPAVFQQRYLQRTQVSVKLPQATYDSMGGDFAAQSNETYDQQKLNDCVEHEDEQSHKNENGGSQNRMHLCASNFETSEQRQVEKAKPTTQYDPNQRKNKKQPEKFHVEMRKLAETQNHSNHINQSDKSKDLNKNLERNDSKSVTNANNMTSAPVSVAPSNRSQNINSKLQPNPVSAPQTGFALNPSSRLLQETVSQKNKTSQKFVPSAPSRTVNELHACAKEFKKPNDVGKTVMVSTCSSARKTLLDSNTDKGAKLKIRSTTVTTASQKTKQTISTVADKAGTVPGTEGQKVSQSRLPEQSQQTSLNSSHESGDGEGHAGKVGQVVTQFGDNSIDVHGMEDIRHQLQGMLRLSHDNLSSVDRSQYEHSDILAGYAGDFGSQHYQRDADMSWNSLRKPQEDELVENFPSFSSQFMVDSGNVSRSDVSLQSENQRLRDLLEKERYRRKHCENYIQQLNVKVCSAPDKKV